MAKDGYFFSFVADVHPKYNVPTKAILLQAAIAAIMVISGTFDQILTYLGFSLGIFPIFAVIGVFKLRQNKSSLKRFGYPFAQIIYIVTGVMILLLAYFERPIESSIAVLTALLGIPVFYFFKKTKTKPGVES